MWKNGKPEHFDREIWNTIRGQVISCIKAHPEYFSEKGMQCAPDSIAKRVYGEVNRILNERV